MDFTVSCQGNDDDVSPYENSSLVTNTQAHTNTRRKWFTRNVPINTQIHTNIIVSIHYT